MSGNDYDLLILGPGSPGEHRAADLLRDLGGRAGGDPLRGYDRRTSGEGRSGVSAAIDVQTRNERPGTVHLADFWLRRAPEEMSSRASGDTSRGAARERAQTSHHTADHCASGVINLSTGPTLKTGNRFAATPVGAHTCLARWCAGSLRRQSS